VSTPPTTTFSVSCLAWVDLPTPTKRFLQKETFYKIRKCGHSPQFRILL
jgi:hypothetical protein